MVDTLIGALVGGSLSFLATWWFYRRAAEDLRVQTYRLRKQSDRLGKQSNQLRKLNVLALRGLEEAGLVEFNRDEEGNPAGLRVTRTVTAHVKPIRASAEMRESATEDPEGE